jgi:hypothetical protein
MATLLILEPIFEADFEDCSYGFRPGRSAHQALEEIRGHIKAGYQAVYDADPARQASSLCAHASGGPECAQADPDVAGDPSRRAQGDRLTGWIESKLEGWLGLEINREKTRVVNLKDEGESLDFLGFTFRYYDDLQGRGWLYLNVVRRRKH